MTDSRNARWAGLQRALRPDYEVLRLLGEGAMGSVYLAREPDLDRVVAVKVLRSGRQEEDSRERLRLEARTVAMLNHPNIVPLHRLIEVEPFICFVMAMVHGETLGARLRRDGPLPPDETRRILAEVAGALDYAHQRGVVHRDVKPDNILIEDESGRPMLTDFGIARTRTSEEAFSEAGHIIGTPSYMSPEQVAGNDAVDGRSDLYALGIVGYEMLTGSPPFPANRICEILRDHLRQELPSLPAVVVHGDLRDILERCLATTPSDRWPDGASLRKALLSDRSHDGALPAELEHLPWGGWMIILAVGSMILPVVDLGIMDQPLRLLWVALGLVWVGALLVARKRGFPWPSIGRALIRQPRWWPGLWYPSRHRRRSDLWERLPRDLRWGRTLFVTGGCAFLIAILTIEIVFAHAARASVSLNALVNARAIGSFTPLHVLNTIPLIGLLLMASGMLLANRSACRHGLDWTNRFLVFTQPTLNPDFWRRPGIVHLLRPVPSEGSDVSTDEAPTVGLGESTTIDRKG